MRSVFAHPGHLGLLLVAVGGAGACGDNLSGADAGPDALGACLDLSTTALPSGSTLASAEVFDTSTCSAETLEGVEIAGSFHAGNFLRLEPDCESGYRLKGLGFGAAEVDDFAHRDDAGLLVRRSVSGFTLAVLFCGENDDGSYAGRFGFCFERGDGTQSCSDFETVITRFERFEGEAETGGLELVAELNGDGAAPWPSAYISNVEFDDRGIAYVTAAYDGLHVIDVSTPAAPVEVGFLRADTVFLNDIKPFGVGASRYLALAGNDGVLVADVTDPMTPTVVSTIAYGAHRIDLEVMGPQILLYVAEGGMPEVAIFDLADPFNPAAVGVVPMGNPSRAVHAPTVLDGRLYSNAGDGGFMVIDALPDPSMPVIHGVYTEPNPQYSHHSGIFDVSGTRYAIHNDEAGAEPWFKIIDVTPGSPTFLQVAGEFLTRGIVASHNITMDGTTAYVAYYQDGVRVLDLSSPAAPTQTAHFNSWQAASAPHDTFEGAVDIARDPATGMLYVADTPRGLLVLRPTP